MDDDTASTRDVPADEGLVDLGLNDRVRALFAPLAEQGFTLGRVSRVDRGMPLVHTGDAVVRAEPAPQLHRAATDAGSRMAVGDWVALARPERHELHMVEVILPRSSAFVRKDPGEHRDEQVLAANIDTVFVAQSADELNVRRLERELVLAWESGARPVVVLTKADLLECDPEVVRERAVAAAPGVDVLMTSAAGEDGLDDVLARMPRGATATLLGASGVGKSTLVNALVGREVQETGAVREGDGKGRHTTVAREIVPIPDAGVIIDTPGLRALALWDVEHGMAAAFADIAELADRCRFGDCAHLDEPGCAVRAAIAAGELPERRLTSYRDLRDELDDGAARRERRSKGRGGRRQR